MTTEHHDTEHPSSLKYVVIAIILSIVTALEVAVVYIEVLSPVLLPLLGILSVGKFIVVVGYYMHLKFDNKLFTLLFATGLILAVYILTALMVLFGVFI
tara:strand:- start:2416 stop:2712 length:297 start_codon:yes stop_codon:yes gene_type:complete